MARRMGARAKILALVLAGPILPSEAAAEIGCSPSYARRIMRELEREGVQARPTEAPYGAAASERVRLVLLEGEASTAAEIAAAARCSVQWARKVLAELAAEEPVFGAARVAEATPAGLFEERTWRVSDAGARALEAERASADASRREAECEAEFTRRDLEDALAFDLF